VPTPTEDHRSEAEELARHLDDAFATHRQVRELIYSHDRVARAHRHDRQKTRRRNGNPGGADHRR
jgi:hypothetical protein